jgi:hypothetical protein
MLQNTTKHYYGSNRVERMLHNFSTPKQCIPSRNIMFASFYLSKVSEILRNTPKHHFGSNGDVSHICYPGSSSFRLGCRFCIFYVSKVNEMLRNTPKHHYGSNGVEWMPHNFGTPKHCIQTPNTSFPSFYLSKVYEILQNTPKHHFESNGVEWMLHNFGIPKQFIQA